MDEISRISTSITVENALDPAASIECRALVDTGAAYLVLPSVWRRDLGPLNAVREVLVQLGDQSQRVGAVCGPVRKRYPCPNRVLNSYVANYAPTTNTSALRYSPSG